MRSWRCESGDQQSAMDHPLRAELVKAADGFHPAAIGFIDMASLAPLTPDAVDLGLDGLKWIDLQWGFQDSALVTRLRVDGPRSAGEECLRCSTSQPSASTLCPLYRPNLTSLFVLSVDLAKTYDQVDTLMKLVNPQSPTEPPNVGILARHGIDLRKELLGHVGPRLAFYAQSPRGEEAATAASMLMSRVAGFTLAAEVRDEAAVSSAIDSLIKSFTPMLREYLRGVPRNRGRFIPGVSEVPEAARTRSKICARLASELPSPTVCDDVAPDRHAWPGPARGERLDSRGGTSPGRRPTLATRRSVHSRRENAPRRHGLPWPRRSPCGHSHFHEGAADPGTPAQRGDRAGGAADGKDRPRRSLAARPGHDPRSSGPRSSAVSVVDHADCRSPGSHTDASRGDSHANLAGHGGCLGRPPGAGDTVDPRGGPARPVREQPQTDRPGDAQLSRLEQCVSPPRDLGREGQTALELASGHLAVHRTTRALRQVQAGRAVG